MQNLFLVGTGIPNSHGGKVFRIEAGSAWEAIAELKRQIDGRRHVRRHAEIGMSLVNSLDEGNLNFVVFDAVRTRIVAGESSGRYQEPATRQLAASLHALIPPALYFDLPYDGTQTPAYFVESYVD